MTSTTQWESLPSWTHHGRYSSHLVLLTPTFRGQTYSCRRPGVLYALWQEVWFLCDRRSSFSVRCHGFLSRSLNNAGNHFFSSQYGEKLMSILLYSVNVWAWASCPSGLIFSAQENHGGSGLSLQSQRDPLLPCQTCPRCYVRLLGNSEAMTAKGTPITCPFESVPFGKPD